MDDRAARTRQRRWSVGVLIVLAAALFAITVSASDTGGSLVAPTGLLVALCLVVGPWIWRLAQERDAERLERIRAQERADVAARVHDSVLQTLALVQRSADDPKRVAALARRQERELRGWLYGDGRIGGRDASARARGRRSPTSRSCTGSASRSSRRATPARRARCRRSCSRPARPSTNAAVHSGPARCRSSSRSPTDEVTVYVRDRGSGLRPAAVPTDRRGIAESIEGRLGATVAPPSSAARPARGPKSSFVFRCEVPS